MNKITAEEAEARKIKSFLEFCYNNHDVVCNQKYDKESKMPLPYSYHLKLADCVYKRYASLLHIHERPLVRMAVAGHDLIEDCWNISYNDVVNEVGKDVADLIYACTEVRGRNSDERHGPEYYDLLFKSEMAIFVKLCDMMANLKFSILWNSSFFNKHRRYYTEMRMNIPAGAAKRFKKLLDDMQNLIVAHALDSEVIIDTAGSLNMAIDREKTHPGEDVTEKVATGLEAKEWDRMPQPHLMSDEAK